MKHRNQLLKNYQGHLNLSSEACYLFDKKKKKWH